MHVAVPRVTAHASKCDTQSFLMGTLPQSLLQEHGRSHDGAHGRILPHAHEGAASSAIDMSDPPSPASSNYADLSVSERLGDDDLVNSEQPLLSQTHAPGVPKKSSKFPLTRVIVIGCVLFANQFSSLIIFPFLPFMIHDFFPNTPMSQLGTYAGILGSAFAVGNLSGSIYWGRAADLYGRRPILIAGLFGTFLASSLFGLSPTFPIAVFSRFLWGLLNGNIGVAKAYLSEICDDSNQAKAFSVIGLASSLGRLTGPAVGAFLAHPAENMPSTFGTNRLLIKYPYALPCFVGSGMCIVCIFLSHRYLKETISNPKPFSLKGLLNPFGTASTRSASGGKKSRSNQNLALARTLPSTSRNSDDAHEHNDSNASPVWVSQSGRSDTVKNRLSRESSSVLATSARTHRHGTSSDNDDDDDDVMASDGEKEQHEAWESTNSGGNTYVKTTTQLPPQSMFAQPPQSRSTLQLAMDRRIGLSTCLYGLIAFIAIIVQEVIPLYWLTGPELSGLNLSMQDMGKMMLYSGPLQFVTQITLFPYLSKKLGYKLLYQSSLVCYCFMLLAIPELHRISPPRPAAPGALVTSPGVHTLYHHHHYHHHHHHFEQHLDDGSAGMLVAINASSTSSSAPPLVDETEGYLIPSKYYLLLPSLLYATMISTSQLTFTSTFVLISNSSPTHERGAANGLGQTYASFARVAGPLVGGALFAWSERNGLPWPLDFHFVWYLEIATVFLALYVAMYLPSDANQRRGT